MKKILATLAFALLALPMAASASSHVTVKSTTRSATAPYSYCTDTSAYGAAYRAVYQYPTGSYWQAQRAAYPQYYAANNAYYQAAYGC